MANPVTDPALLALLNAPDEGAKPAVTSTADASGEAWAPEVVVHGEPEAASSGGTPVTDPALLAQLNGEAQSEGPAAVPAIPAPSKEQSVVPHAADRFKQGVASLLGLAGAPVSIADTAGTAAVNNIMAPFSAAADLLHKVGFIDKDGSELFAKASSEKETIGGMSQVTRGWEKALRVQKLKAPLNIYGNVSKTNEYIGTIAEFMGGALLPGTGAVVSAQRKLATAVVTTLGTLSSATSAVEGKDIAGRMAPNFGLTKEQGEEIGYMVGSLAGPKIIGMAGQAVVKSLNVGGAALAKGNITGFSKQDQNAAANAILHREIAASITAAPNSLPNVAKALDYKRRIDGFSPNAAQMSDAPGLRAMYREVTNKSPAALAKAAASEQRNLEAIANYSNKVFPKNGQSLTDPARVKLAADRAVLDLQEATAAAKLRDLSDKFRTRVDNEAVGQELRSLYWAKRASAKGRVDQELGQVYATAKKYGIQEDMSDVRSNIAKIVAADRTTFQDMPPVFAKVLREYPEGNPGVQASVYSQTRTGVVKGRDNASFEELHSLYKQANADWADATAAGNSTKAFYMKMVRDQLGEKVAKYNGEQYGELAQKFQGYNANYAKYAHTFREGAGGEIAKRTKAGIATDSEDIVSKVILQSGDKKRGVRDFFQLYGNDVRAAELLHEGMLDNFSKATMCSGTLNPKAAQAWMYKHQAALDELPELKKALGNTATIADDLVFRQRQLQAQRKVLDKTVLAKIAKMQDPDKLVQQALTDPKLMKGLLVGAHSPEAKQAIARAIVDSLGKQGQGLEFLTKHEASLKPVMESLGKGHWDNVKAIAEMETIAARTKAPTAVELSKIKDIGEQLIGTSVNGMISRVKNSATPLGLSPTWVTIDVGGRFFYKIRSEELARLREHAMTDSDAAELLFKTMRKSTYTPKDLLDLQRISYNAGANSLAQGLEEQRRHKAGTATPTTTRWEPSRGGLTEKVDRPRDVWGPFGGRDWSNKPKQQQLEPKTGGW